MTGTNHESIRLILNHLVIDREEWSTFAPAFMQLAARGPGVAPAHSIADHANHLLPFSLATTVVDMGCGPGQITDAVLQQHAAALPPAARVLGADNNPQMLAQYTARKHRQVEQGDDYWARVETIETDIHTCSGLDDDSVSHMLAGFVVFLVPEPAKAVEAMRKKLAPGGVLALTSWAGSEWQDLMYYPMKVRKDLAMPTLPATWTQPDGVGQQLQSIGFKDVDVVQTEGYLTFTDYDEICRFILTKMPLAARVVAQMSDEEVLSTHALMVADLKARHPTVPAKMVGTATVAYCRK